MSVRAKALDVLRQHLADPAAFAERYRMSRTRDAAPEETRKQRRRSAWSIRLEAQVESWPGVGLCFIIGLWIVANTWRTPRDAALHQAIIAASGAILLWLSVDNASKRIIYAVAKRPVLFHLMTSCVLCASLFIALGTIHEYAISQLCPGLAIFMVVTIKDRWRHLD